MKLSVRRSVSEKTNLIAGNGVVLQGEQLAQLGRDGTAAAVVSFTRPSSSVTLACVF